MRGAGQDRELGVRQAGRRVSEDTAPDQSEPLDRVLRSRLAVGLALMTIGSRRAAVVRQEESPRVADDARASQPA
ncbi:MAG: hypothetical protein ACRDXB_19550 [Actinomycetes bacterium]